MGDSEIRRRLHTPNQSFIWADHTSNEKKGSGEIEMKWRAIKSSKSRSASDRNTLLGYHTIFRVPTANLAGRRPSAASARTMGDLHCLGCFPGKFGGSRRMGMDRSFLTTNMRCDAWGYWRTLRKIVQVQKSEGYYSETLLACFTIFIYTKIEIERKRQTECEIEPSWPRRRLRMFGCTAILILGPTKNRDRHRRKSVRRNRRRSLFLRWQIPNVRHTKGKNILVHLFSIKESYFPTKQPSSLEFRNMLRTPFGRAGDFETPV